MNVAQSTIIGITALAILLPFAFSLLIALMPDARPKNKQDYFLYGKQLDAGSFVTSSVGYSTQVASIFLFLYWFFQYGLSSLFVPVAWGLGYILVAYLVKFRLLDSFLNSTSSVETLHGYIGRIFSPNGSRAGKWLVYVAAISTLLGFGGSLSAEIDYATRYFLLPALGLPTTQHDSMYLVGAQFLVLAFSGCYILWGGYKAAVMTDQFQIYLAYGSFVVVSLIMSIYATYTSHSLAAILCTIAIGYFLWDFYRRRRQVHEIEKNYTEFPSDRRFFYILIIVTLAALVAQLYLLFFRGHYHPFDSTLLPPPNGSFWGFGVLGVISLLIANFFWQLIDLSCLQRLQSVAFDSNDEHSRQRIYRGLVTSGFESFGIWVFTIVFAILVKSLGGGYDNVPALLLSLGNWNLILLPVLCFLVVSFMVSTLACFISASAFVTYYDIVPRNTHSAHDLDLHHPRFWTLLILCANFAAYWVLIRYFNSQIGQILYGFYSLQASIFVVVLVSFFSEHFKSFGKRFASPGAGVFAIVIGWFFGFATAISPTPWLGIDANSWYVIPPLAAVGTSFLAYILIVLLRAGVSRIINDHF